jgi:hypothetical protein
MPLSAAAPPPMAATAFFLREAPQLVCLEFAQQSARTSVLSTFYYLLNLYRVGVLKLFIKLQQILIIYNYKESV